jgi:hypothetical protein
MNPIHISRADVLHFVKLQQRVAEYLKIKLPLLNGMYMLVPSSHLQQQQGCSGSDSSAEAAAIPWRLRQVSAVEVVPGGDPADATVVLVGGDRVRAGAVREGLLDEVQDYQVSSFLSPVVRNTQAYMPVSDMAHLHRLPPGATI